MFDRFFFTFSSCAIQVLPAWSKSANSIFSSSEFAFIHLANCMTCPWLLSTTTTTTNMLTVTRVIYDANSQLWCIPQRVFIYINICSAFSNSYRKMTGFLALLACMSHAQVTLVWHLQHFNFQPNVPFLLGWHCFLEP